jgi:hypothetical protein
VEGLADEFYRLAHDDVTGRPRLHARAVGLGLAAALLGELVESRHVAVWDGELRVIDRSPPEDAVCRSILDLLLANPAHVELRTWLDYLSRSAAHLVAERLWRAGQVRPHTRRRSFLRRRRSVRYVPVDLNQAAWPAARISTRLLYGRPLTDTDIFLTGLVFATGLDELLLSGASAQVRERGRDLVRGLDVARWELVTATRAAAGDAVLCYRS